MLQLIAVFGNHAESLTNVFLSFRNEHSHDFRTTARGVILIGIHGVVFIFKLAVTRERSDKSGALYNSAEVQQCRKRRENFKNNFNSFFKEREISDAN